MNLKEKYLKHFSKNICKKFKNCHNLFLENPKTIEEIFLKNPLIYEF